MNIEQAQALAMICHYAKEYLKDNKTMSQSVDIAQGIIKKQLNAFDTLSKDYEKVMKELSKEIEKNRALNEILALHDKWLGNEMSDFEFFTLLSEIKYKYGLSKI